MSEEVRGYCATHGHGFYGHCGDCGDRAELARVTAERDEARETLRGVRECIELFDHTAVYDLKSDLLAILEGDTE